MKRNIFLMSGIICLAVSAMTTVHAQSAETVKSSADGQAPDGQHGKNMFVDGDFESQAKALCANATADKVHDDAVHVYEGNPAPKDVSHKGKYCLSLDLKSEVAVISFQKYSQVDASKTYRMSVSFFIPSKTSMCCTGYAYNKRGDLLKNEKGDVWGYNLGVKEGPMEGWKKAEITIGPKGSSTDFIWPLGTEQIGMNVYLRSEKGTVYLDDITIEECPSGSLPAVK